MLPRGLLAALLAGALACSCGDDTSSTRASNAAPKVSLTPLDSELVATGLDLTVSVTGCPKGVARVWITEGERILAELSNPEPTATLRVELADLAWNLHGIPADIAVTAHASCTGGTLTGDSTPSSTRFMPVSKVLPGPWSFGQNFWVDRPATSFIACDTRLKRLASDGKSLGGFDLPFTCSASSELTFSEDGKRYLLEPGVGVVGFDASAKMTLSLTGFDVLQLAAPATGPLAVLGVHGVLAQLRGYDRATGNRVWPANPDAVDSMSDGRPAGRIAVNSKGQVVFPNAKQPLGSSSMTLGIELYDQKTGALIDDRSFGTLPVETLSTIQIPTISFDAKAEVAFFAERKDPSRVWACNAIDDLLCTDAGGGLEWKSSALPGGVHTAVRTSHALVAFGERVAFFLNPATGALLTPIDAPIVPQGSLVFTVVLGGADGSTYLLAQAPNPSGGLLSGIREVVIFDKPNARAADYVTWHDQGYMVDVDLAGRAWLWSYDLFSLKLPAEYRGLLQ